MPWSPSVPIDCSSAKPTRPAWFASCLSEGACIQVTIQAPSVSALVLQPSTLGTNVTAGYDWCIDHTNRLVYAKLAAPPPSSVAFFAAVDDATGHSCRFLTHHWVDGDLIRVYERRNLTCDLDWTQLPGPENITKGTLRISP